MKIELEIEFDPKEFEDLAKLWTKFFGTKFDVNGKSNMNMINTTIESKEKSLPSKK